MPSLPSMPVRSPGWTLIYSGIDITSAVSPMITRISYRDYLSELSGEIDIEVEDHNQQWQSSWYPTLGDEVSLSIGYAGESMLPCGDFQVDQVELNGPPDRFMLRCLAAFITPALRTANSVGYEGQTLLGIAQTIGAKYGLSTVSAPAGIDVAFQRITQKRESDVAFLKRLAVENGYAFTVRGSSLVFYEFAVLLATPPTMTVNKTEVESFEFRNATYNTYGLAQVAYHNPLSKSLILESAVGAAETPAGEIRKIVARSENGQQALFRAQSATQASDLRLLQGSITMPGSAQMCSGNTIGISGFANFDGIYLITAAHHTIDRAHGYITRVEVSRVV